MFLAPFLVNRIGAKRGLLLSGVIMALHFRFRACRRCNHDFIDETATCG